MRRVSDVLNDEVFGFPYLTCAPLDPKLVSSMREQDPVALNLVSTT